MSEERRHVLPSGPADELDAPSLPPGPGLVAKLAADVLIALLMAVLVVATLLFATGISQFVYIDF